MEGSVKTGLSSQEKITQKKPATHDEATQRPQAKTEKVTGSNKPGKLTIK